MTRAAGEAFERLVPDRRILMFSRSSFVGMHRYGGVWTGDNRSRWGHILLNLQQLTGLNMCGFLYCGADVGAVSYTHLVDQYNIIFLNHISCSLGYLAFC